MKRRILAFCLAASWIAACGRLPSQETSRSKVEIDLPKDKIKAESVSQFLKAFESVMQEGRHEIDLSVLVGQASEGETPDVLQQILQSREQTAPIECTGRKCRIESLGEAITFKIDSINLPVVGRPQVTLDKRIEIFTELSADLRHLNVCRIHGVKLKASLLTPAVNGILVELDEQGAKVLKLGVGPGGRYPDDSCR